MMLWKNLWFFRLDEWQRFVLTLEVNPRLPLDIFDTLLGFTAIFVLFTAVFFKIPPDSSLCMDEEVKLAKEAFVTGHNGTTMWEVNAVCLMVPVSVFILLVCCFCEASAPILYAPMPISLILRRLRLRLTLPPSQLITFEHPWMSRLGLCTPLVSMYSTGSSIFRLLWFHV